MIGLAEKRIHIAAPLARVFSLFTTSAGLTEWMAAEAEVDLRPGGRWRWVHDNGDTTSGEYLVVDPPHRVAFTFGWESGPHAAMAPGSTRVDVEFIEDDTGTTVTLRHSAVPVEFVDPHLAGWTYFLGLLADVATGVPTPSTRRPDTGD